MLEAFELALISIVLLACLINCTCYILLVRVFGQKLKRDQTALLGIQGSFGSLRNQISDLHDCVEETHAEVSRQANKLSSEFEAFAQKEVSNRNITDQLILDVREDIANVGKNKRNRKTT